MGSQKARDRHPSRSPAPRRSRCAEASELEERGGRSRLRPGTRILDASATLWLEPLSAMETLEPERCDDGGLGPPPLSRRGTDGATQRAVPATALETRTGAAVPPRPTAPVDLEDSRDPRTSLRTRDNG